MHRQWQITHNRLARAGLQDIKEILKRQNISNSLPNFSKNLLEWISQARPTVEGKQRTFVPFPFWEEIYKDEFHSIMIVGGRQIFKTTYLTDMIAYEATTNPNAQICYVTFSQESLRSFSKQKLHTGTFRNNPLLAQFIRKGQGNVGEIPLKNGSTIYCTTDTNGYKNVEGKSLFHCYLDEAQYQEMEHAQKVIQAMMATKGKLTLSGIGGESGSPYEEFWNKSDQREWVYDDLDWRTKLQFDKNGFVIGDYLKEILRGRWVAQRPENTLFHGYHIAQTVFPTIPLTEDNAVSLYKINPMFSIEYQKKNSMLSIFTTHTMGEFYNTTKRPVTPEIVLACMNPYRHLSLLTWEEIAKWHAKEQDNIKIGLGVDWGSGNPSHTVIAIVAELQVSDDQKQYHLVHLEKRPPENQIDQAEYVRDLVFYAKCNTGIGDLGYGANQVKIIQDGGYRRSTGKYFEGLGDRRFLGCRTVSDESKPFQHHEEKTDQHGQETSRLDIDKTTAIQGFIDILSSTVNDPLDNTKRLSKLIIPYHDQQKVDWLVKDFISITRKDLEKTNVMVDPRQHARKEFNHPKDSVMAIIYAIFALQLDITWKIGGITPLRRWD